MSDPESLAAAAARTRSRQLSRSLVVWAIPLKNGSVLEVAALPGQVTVFVGPNGSGKSALSFWLSQNGGPERIVKRVIAHRKLWLLAAGGDITFAERDATLAMMVTWDNHAESRWLDRADNQRASIALLNFLALENNRNALVARLLEGGQAGDRILEAVPASPINALNGILRAAGLHVQLGVGRHAALEAQRTDSSQRYPANQMSDGEKSALLLVAEVLTAPADSVVVIDEPERHLHRAISAELVGAILASRPDCHFVLTTHDIELAALMHSSSARVFSLSDSAWGEADVQAWSARALDEGMSEEVRLAVLGGRAKVIFVEGKSGSPDVALYRLLFPDWSMSPVGSCEAVIRSVVGLNSNLDIHWITARGVVDNDGRTDEEAKALRNKGVIVLPVNEIESLLYHPSVVEAIAQRQVAVFGGDPVAMRDGAINAALHALGAPGVAERLAKSACMKVLTRRLIDAVPDQKPEAAGAEVSIRVVNPFEGMLREIRRALETDDFMAVARIAPIRDSSALARIRETLKLPKKDDYEAAARTQIASSPALREELAAVVGDLP